MVTKPDKGRGVVTIHRASYNEKMEKIVDDRSKFSIVTDPMLSTIRQVEDKINRLLAKIQLLGMITEDLYKSLFVWGSIPGILYGLPKIHKTLVPLRPIFSACGIPAYCLAKFIVSVLSRLTKNEFTVPNSYGLADELRQMDIADDSRVLSGKWTDVLRIYDYVPFLSQYDRQSGSWKNPTFWTERNVYVSEMKDVWNSQLFSEDAASSFWSSKISPTNGLYLHLTMNEWWLFCR